ncbi:hypothetical protein ACI79P_19115 [Blastococcus sp. SYSU DS0510]
MSLSTGRTGSRSDLRRGRPCTRRLLVLVAAVPVAFGISVTPAGGVPTEGDAVPSVSDPAAPRWGCGDGPREQAFFGQRYGCLTPDERGPVLESTDR